MQASSSSFSLILCLLVLSDLFLNTPPVVSAYQSKKEACIWFDSERYLKYCGDDVKWPISNKLNTASVDTIAQNWYGYFLNFFDYSNVQDQGRPNKKCEASLKKLICASHIKRCQIVHDEKNQLVAAMLPPCRSLCDDAIEACSQYLTQSPEILTSLRDVCKGGDYPSVCNDGSQVPRTKTEEPIAYDAIIMGFVRDESLQAYLDIFCLEYLGVAFDEIWSFINKVALISGTGIVLLVAFATWSIKNEAERALRTINVQQQQQQQSKAATNGGASTPAASKVTDMIEIADAKPKAE